MSCDSVRARRSRVDAKGVDVPFHEVAQCLINHSMARHGVLAPERFGLDRELPVAAAGGPRSRVPRMLPAFVLQFESRGPQRRQPFADGVLDRVHGVSYPSLKAGPGGTA